MKITTWVSISPKITSTIGLQAKYLSNEAMVFLSPILNINYKTSDRFYLKGALSIYQQSLRKMFFEYRGVPIDLWVTSSADDIPVISCRNSMIGASYIHDKFTIDGRSAGLDVTLASNLNAYNFILAYRVGYHQEQYDDINRGDYFASEYDNRHQIKLSNNYKLPKFDFSLNTIYSSGR